MYYEIGYMYEVELPISGSDDIRNEIVLEIFRFPRDRIKRIHVSTRTSDWYGSKS